MSLKRMRLELARCAARRFRDGEGARIGGLVNHRAPAYAMREPDGPTHAFRLVGVGG